MKLNWDSLLEPIFLFILALIAGTLWVIVPIQQKPAKVPTALVEQAAPVVAIPKPVVRLPKAAPKQPKPGMTEPDPEAKRLAQERAVLVQTVQAVQTDWSATQQSLTTASEEQQRLDAAILQEQQKLSGLKKGQAVDPKPEARAPSEQAAEIERLQGAVQTKKTEIAKLETELNNTRNPFEKEVASLPKASPATKLPMLVELFHNHAIPVDKKHFKFMKQKTTTLATRESDGETSEQIKSPDSDFSKYLAGIKPAKQYLACLLNDDSFDIFREIREIARAKGVGVGWEPIDTAAGKITLYPIHFTNNPNRGQKVENGKTLPRVTSIIE
ncbi:MAG: hypothetical protein M3Z23_14585 [Acidobacteriota bacterium]|nr:hypothetical protein [Acidobacteriota bacterium]